MALVAVALVAAMGLFAFIATAPGVFANPNSASNLGTNTVNANANTVNNQCSSDRIKADLSVGQTINISSIEGSFNVVGDRSQNGTASGTLTFTVTSALKTGYTLALTSGSLDLNGTTYTITSGSAETGIYAQNLVGQGETSPAGTFLIRANSTGNFGGVVLSQVRMDFNTSAAEYAVYMIGDVD
jgi:hypothetical protein